MAKSEILNNVMHPFTSPILSKMIESKKGYRTENFSGSLVRNLYDIIRYEFSMGNSDIVSYIQKQ